MSAEGGSEKGGTWRVRGRADGEARWEERAAMAPHVRRAGRLPRTRCDATRAVPAAGGARARPLSPSRSSRGAAGGATAGAARSAASPLRPRRHRRHCRPSQHRRPRHRCPQRRRCRCPRDVRHAGVAYAPTASILRGGPPPRTGKARPNCSLATAPAGSGAARNFSSPARKGSQPPWGLVGAVSDYSRLPAGLLRGRVAVTEALQQRVEVARVAYPQLDA